VIVLNLVEFALAACQPLRAAAARLALRSPCEVGEGRMKEMLFGSSVKIAEDGL
jgi:hypothetical protein